MKEKIIGAIDNLTEVRAMSKIVELISDIKGIRVIGGCAAKQIEEAQKKLELVFPKEYKEYLLNFGTVCFNGVELCGLNVTGYLNVVEATEQEKSVNSSFPKGMFVIEDLGIDERLIICDEKGYVYLLQRDKKKLICTSFYEYVDKCKYR